MNISRHCLVVAGNPRTQHIRRSKPLWRLFFYIMFPQFRHLSCTPPGNNPTLLFLKLPREPSNPYTPSSLPLSLMPRNNLSSMSNAADQVSRGFFHRVCECYVHGGPPHVIRSALVWTRHQAYQDAQKRLGTETQTQRPQAPNHSDDSDGNNQGSNVVISSSSESDHKRSHSTKGAALRWGQRRRWHKRLKIRKTSTSSNESRIESARKIPQVDSIPNNASDTPSTTLNNHSDISNRADFVGNDLTQS